MWFLLDQSGQIMRLLNILLDQTAKLASAVGSNRKPYLQRLEVPGKIDSSGSKFRRPRRNAPPLRAEITRSHHKSTVMRFPVSNQDAASLKRHVHPLMEVERNRISEIQPSNLV